MRVTSEKWRNPRLDAKRFRAVLLEKFFSKLPVVLAPTESSVITAHSRHLRNDL